MRLEYVQEFLASKGYDWRREYFNGETLEYETAETFGDIRSNLLRLTCLKLYKGESAEYVDFLLTESQFQQFREEPEILGSGSQFYVDKDYSEEWIMFQANKLDEIAEQTYGGKSTEDIEMGD